MAIYIVIHVHLWSLVGSTGSITVVMDCSYNWYSRLNAIRNLFHPVLRLLAKIVKLHVNDQMAEGQAIFTNESLLIISFNWEY